MLTKNDSAARRSTKENVPLSSMCITTKIQSRYVQGVCSTLP